MNVRRNMMRTLVVTALLGVLMLSIGCRDTEMRKAHSEVPLCTGCGQIKGTEACCNPDAAACAGCGLAKGSPGCCIIEEGAETAALCGGCGHIKGSDACCQPGQATCAGCGLVKGSPGCCKLPKS